MFFLEVAIVLSGYSILKLIVFTVCIGFILLCFRVLYEQGKVIFFDEEIVYGLERLKGEINYYDKKLKSTNHELEKINQEMSNYVKEE